MEYALDTRYSLNMFSLLAKTLDAHINEDPNVLGFSDSPKGARQVVLKKINNIKMQINNKILFGLLYHTVLDQEPVRNQIAFDCYSALHTTEPLTEIVARKEDYWEIRPGKFIRIHPDLYTNLFLNEYKSTAEEVRDFKPNKDDLKVWQYEQLNGYLGFYKKDVGFLHEINQRGFLNPITRENGIDVYWNKIHLSYDSFVPVRFDKEMYETTVKTLIYLFDCIDKKKVEIECPRFVFECKNCEMPDLGLCKNPITSMKLDHIEKCCSCNRVLQKEKIKVRGKWKEDFPNVFERNKQIFCKEGKCEQAVIQAWRYE